MVGRAIAVFMACGLAIAGCARDSSDAIPKRRDVRPVTDVVARVGGRPIGVAEVEARMKADGIDAKAALEALIEEELLAEEAVRLGFTEDAEARRAAERLMVRSMLHDIEREITPESIPEQEVRQDFKTYADKLQSPERRRSWHILVREPSDEGKKLAQSILDEVLEAEEPRSVYERYAEGGAPDAPSSVKAEELPAITMKAGMAKPYKEALFAAKSTGVLPHLVKTSYGWHVIFLEEIVPAEHKTLQDVEGEIRERLSQKKRFQRVVAIVDALRAHGLVTYDEENVEHLLSMSGLPRRAQ